MKYLIGLLLPVLPRLFNKLSSFSSFGSIATLRNFFLDIITENRNILIFFCIIRSVPSKKEKRKENESRGDRITCNHFKYLTVEWPWFMAWLKWIFDNFHNLFSIAQLPLVKWVVPVVLSSVVYLGVLVFDSLLVRL